MPIRAVWFDVGETLIDESEIWGEWADWLGVPRHTFSAVFGAFLAQGENHRKTFEHFKPGFDLEAEQQARRAAGHDEYRNGFVLYPDVRPCLTELREAGYFIGIAGNQPIEADAILRRLDLPADVIATSAEWGVTKPDLAFFEKLIEVSGHLPEEIVYVGDRRNNDVTSPMDAGLHAFQVRRGPWGYIDSAEDDRVIPDLAGLPARLR